MTLRIIACFLIILCLAIPSNLTAQPAIDASLHGDWLQGSEVWGTGGALHVVFADYAVEVVTSGSYYFADDDSTESWSFGVDANINLPPIGFVRPYGGAGFVQFRRYGDLKWLLNLTVGMHARLLGDRIVPFIEGGYRPADSLNPWRIRSGLRLILASP